MAKKFGEMIYLGSFDSTNIKEVSNIYLKTKYLIIKAEEIDPLNSKTYLQPRLECFQAFDHLMCAVASENASLDLDNVKKHTATGFYDAADWVIRLIKFRIAKEIKRYSDVVILEAFPDYYETVLTDVEGLTDEITAMRMSKTHEQSDEIDRYVGIIDRAHSHLATVISKKRLGYLIYSRQFR